MRRAIHNQETRNQLARMSRAVRPYLVGNPGTAGAALEVASNVLTVMLLDPRADAYELTASHISRSVEAGWFGCVNVDTAARAGAIAWRDMQGGL